MAYRQACLDIVKRHNPKATKEEIDDLEEEGIQTTTIPWIKDYEN